MNKLTSLLLPLIVVTLGFSQEARKPSASDSTPSALQSMVDTERAFAKMSEEQGTRPAFMAFIADDGILFRPTAVKGKQWMSEHPVPASDKRSLLSWYPSVAGMARAGDLGYTTGPWEFKNDIHDAKASAWGNFLTVWKKQGDGSWKFAIDLGISNPQPQTTIAPWQPPKKHSQPEIARPHNIASERDVLLARDREFATASSKSGGLQALQLFAAADVRVFREGVFPGSDKPSATMTISKGLVAWTWQPLFADVSASGDLGYSHGLYELKKNGPGSLITEKGNYFRIWQKQNGPWAVIVDLANPLPPETQKN
jgi:ketosteroid isomerase-like protein